MKITKLLMLTGWIVAFSATLAMADLLTACDLMTVEEAQKAAGVKLAQGQLTDLVQVSGMTFMKGKTLCHFESLDGKHWKRFVGVELSQKDSSEEAAAEYSQLIKAIDTSRTVSGIGDKAIWAGSSFTPNGGLHVLSGSCCLHIKINTEDENNDLKQAKALADFALKRMKK